MKLFACIVEEHNGKWCVPCGSFSYVRLDGRLSAENALNEAVDHFTKTQPNAKGIAVFRAENLRSRGRVVAAFPSCAKDMFQNVVFENCY